MIAPKSEITYEGQPIQVLQELIKRRVRLLGETCKDAITATAITVLKSLRADTKIAPKKARKTSYRITDTGWVGGWERHDGVYHRVPRTSSDRRAPKVPGVFPVNLAGQHYVKGEIVRVYKVETVNDKTMIWEKTKHKGCWYVFAKSEKIARKFAEEHMTRRIQTYRGLAKSALGFAMAAVSGRGAFAAEVRTQKSRRAAMSAVKIYKNSGNNTYSITVKDILNYSGLALKSGAGAVDMAMKKAANSIAGRLSKVAVAKLNQKIPTPFPEVKG